MREQLSEAQGEAGVEAGAAARTQHEAADLRRQVAQQTERTLGLEREAEAAKAAQAQEQRGLQQGVEALQRQLGAELAVRTLTSIPNRSPNVDP